MEKVGLPLKCVLTCSPKCEIKAKQFLPGYNLCFTVILSSKFLGFCSIVVHGSSPGPLIIC